MWANVAGKEELVKLLLMGILPNFTGLCALMKEPSIFPAPDRTTKVYRALDEFGNLLYVGISSNLRARMAVHKQNSRWWSQAEEITWESLPTRLGAMQREADLVGEFQPPYNVDLTGRPKGWMRGERSPAGVVLRVANHVQYCIEKDGVATMDDITRYTTQVFRALVNRKAPIKIVDNNGKFLATLNPWE